MDLEDQLLQLARAARDAARPLARAPARQRTAAIMAVAAGLEGAAGAISAANREDVDAAREAGLSSPMQDRLTLTPQRLQALAQSVSEIAAQADPVGHTTRTFARPNGLKVAKVRLPLGVVLMIYEARPNVTVDAAALGIRSGNAIILRGGSEAARTNAALAQVVRGALQATDLPAASVQWVPTQAREAIDCLLRLDDCIDLVIPRGGEGLIRRVVQTSRIPVVRHYKGICHVFVEATGDVAQAARIVENAKVQRPGVCNALETLLVDAAIASVALPAIAAQLAPHGVELRGCPRTVAVLPQAKAAVDGDWDTEFLALILAVKVVDGIDAAIAHIDAHGTQHTASIVTQNLGAAQRFVEQVEASCVLVNASTRFNDGGELGMGAEMGISTSRVHAFGPMGAESLTAEKFVVYGEGQVR